MVAKDNLAGHQTATTLTPTMKEGNMKIITIVYDYYDTEVDECNPIEHEIKVYGIIAP